MPLSQKLIRHIIISSFLEFGPVIIFLFSTNFKSMYESTTILMVATIVSTIITYRIQKRIPYLALYVAFITLIFGYLTIHFQEPKFIQIRDTLYDITCATTLILGIIFNINFLKIAFNSVLHMTTRAWDKITHLWIGYFILIAFSNEIVRRLFSLEEWLEFKGVMVLITSIFGLIALYISYEKENK